MARVQNSVKKIQILSLLQNCSRFKTVARRFAADLILIQPAQTRKEM